MKINSFSIFAKTGIMIAVLVLAACNAETPKETESTTDVPDSSHDWISEEVLNQLQDINAELRLLRAEVKSLNARLDGAQIKDGAHTKVPSGGLAINLSTAWKMGNNNARVGILEFTDFQCPYCGKHHRNAFENIKEHYIDAGKVQYFAMDYPLSFHENAHSAAIVAQCAGQQGKYWEMHDALFDNQGNLGEGLYAKLASKVGLNASDFNACLEDPAVSKKVDQDIIAGSRYGVRGTPAFFLGRIEDGKLIDVIPMRGAQPYKRFSRVIDTLLSSDGSK